MTASNADQTSVWVPIARILRPQGRRGEVLCDLLTDLPAAEQFTAGRTLAPALSSGAEPSATPLTLESYFLPLGRNAGRIVLKLAGCDSISAAERLAGLQLLVPAADLPTLDSDTFYVNDLLGCTLFNGSEPVGTVTDVEFATSPDGKTRLPDAAPLLCVHVTGAPAESDPILVPFVRAQLTSVDLVTKQIHMHLPEGLLDAGPTPAAADADPSTHNEPLPNR